MSDYCVGSIVEKARLPVQFPTHGLPAAFWEQLGRVIGTFGCLEEVLGIAIFALTGTQAVEEAEAEEALNRWGKALEHALIDTLLPLITRFGDAVRAHPQTSIANLDELLANLKRAAELRNVLCHGSWRTPDEHGNTMPFFVDRKLRVFDTRINTASLMEVQEHAAELVCEVLNSVTHTGMQFPGSNGPGKPVW